MLESTSHVGVTRVPQDPKHSTVVRNTVVLTPERPRSSAVQVQFVRQLRPHHLSRPTLTTGASLFWKNTANKFRGVQRVFEIRFALIHEGVGSLAEVLRPL